MHSDPTTIWTNALSELELQMTRGTFDAWLRHTRCLGVDSDGETLIIAAPNAHAVEWLENRLYTVIDRTLHRLSGNGTRARFILAERPPARSPAAPALPASTLDPLPSADWSPPDFDPADTKRVSGWIPLPEYATLFWAPLLGASAWRIWEIVRRSDKRRDKDDFTPPLRFSIPQLARLIPCSHQSITGRNVRCAPDTPGAQQIKARGGRARLGSEPETIWARHYPGALEILEREGVAEIERHGDRKAAVVLISVRVNLPLLHPAQVDQLPPDLQAEHDRWIAAHGLDPTDWQ